MLNTVYTERKEISDMAKASNMTLDDIIKKVNKDAGSDIIGYGIHYGKTDTVHSAPGLCRIFLTV